jgi:flagellar M-ring protein FliF
MNPLNQITKQISELIASMTPAARIMAGLLFATIVVSLGWIVSLQQGNSYEYLLGGQVMTESELKKAEQSFGIAALADYQRDGMRLKVPKGTKDLYLKALSANDAMPDEWGTEKDRSLKSGNPFESTDLLSLRHEAAREKELARIIQRMPNVDFASVEYDKERAGFARSFDRTCSVQVQSRSRRPIEPAVLKKIHQTTVSYFAGLKPEYVTVTDLSGTGEVFHGTSDPMITDNQLYLQAQISWEERYRSKCLNVLDHYGEVKLEVAVELDPTLQKELEQLKYDPTPTTLASTTSKKDLENSKPAPGGRPGTEPNAISNQPQSLNTAQAPQQTSKVKETAENQQAVAGHEASITKTAPLVPQSVRVTVGIPESYFSKVYASRHEDFKGGEIPAAELALLKTETEKNVRSAVEGQLKGVRAGEERFPLVSFYSYPDLPLPPIPEPSMTAQATTWLAQSWSTLALIGIVLVTMFMMMGWIKAQATSPRDKDFSQGFGLEVPASAAEELDLGEEAGSPQEAEEKPKFQVTGGEMKEDLTSLIKENPDVAVNLLRSWIGEAA